MSVEPLMTGLCDLPSCNGLPGLDPVLVIPLLDAVDNSINLTGIVIVDFHLVILYLKGVQVLRQLRRVLA